MPVVYTPSALAAARKKLGGAKPGHEVANQAAKVEEDAYKATAKRLKEEQDAQDKAAKAAAKAALVAQNNEREAAYRAENRPHYTDASGAIQPTHSDEQWAEKKQRNTENDQRASRYFQENRPYRYDERHNVVPRHTDEEWDALKRKKAAKLEAAQVDKANKAFRDEAKRGIDAQQGVLVANDDTIQRSVQETDLKVEGIKAERRRVIDRYKQMAKDIDDGKVQVRNYAGTMAHIADTIRQADADIAKADDELRSHKASALTFQKQQDALKQQLRQREIDVPTLEAPEADKSVRAPMGVRREASAPVERKPAQDVPNLRKRVLDAWAGSVAQDATVPDAQRRAMIEDIAARKDPAAYETLKRQRYTQADAETLQAALEHDAQTLEARQADHAERLQALSAEQSRHTAALEALEQTNARRLNAPHRAGDLVMVNGKPMFADLAERYTDLQSRAKQWQDDHQAEADTLDIEAEELDRDVRLMKEGERVLNAKVAAENTKRRTEAYAQLNSVPGDQKLGDQLKAVHDAVDQHRGGDDAGLTEWADKETQRIQTAATAHLDREREKTYQELNAVPGAKGAGDELAKLDAEVEPHLGGDDAGVKEYYEKRRKEILGKVQQGSKQAQEATNAIYAKLANQLFEQNVHEPWWARTSEKNIEGDPDKLLTSHATTTTAQEKMAFEQAVDELTQKLGGKAETKGVMGTPVRSPERQQAINLLRDARANDWSSGDTSAPVRYDSKGTILVNPDKYLDATAFKAAVEEAEGTQEEKAAVLKQFPELNQRAAKAQIDTLRTLGVYRDWEAKQPADMPEAEKLAKFREENSGVFNSGACKVRLHQALLGVASGVVGLAQSAVGTYEAITRSRGAMDAYKSLIRDSAQMGESSNVLPTGQWVNMGTSMVISTVPSLAVGGVAGAVKSASLQKAAKTLTLKQVLKGGKGIAGLKTAEQARKAAEAFGLKSAAAAAGLQTFGSMYGNAVEGYVKNGAREDAALNKAFIPALASAATTYLLTAAGGTKGAEALLRQESFRKNFKSWFQAVASGSVQEGLREEAPDQLMQGMLERYTYNPRKSWNEIATETLVAGIGGALMGGGFEAMNTRFQPEKEETLESIVAAALQLAASSSTPADLVGSAQAPKPEAAPASPVAPHQESGKSGAVEGPADKSGRAPAPETLAAAEAAIEAFADPKMKPQAVEDTQAKARVVLQIAQGVEMADLTDEQLRLVGLNRDGTPGHFENVPVDKKDAAKGSTRVWTKGARADGFQPVVVEDGKLIITQRQIDNLKKRLPAVAQAIGLSEVERRNRFNNPPPPMKDELTERQKQALAKMPLKAAHKKLIALGMPRHEADKLLNRLKGRN